MEKSVIPMDSFTQRFHVSTSHRSHFYTRPVLCIQNTFFPNDLTAYSLDTEMLSSQVSTEEVVSDLQKKKGQKLK